MARNVAGLNPPSDSDGPIRLLSCVVSPNGLLEAEVESRSDDALRCNIHCNYEFGGKPFTHWFEVNIPKRYMGRVGRFDTSGGRAGNFSGEVGTCRKTEARWPGE
ncbi:MAG TPA: hypothetical protein VFZ95_10795 [Steroidobacteraceae bacterium]